jgi:hypothetical protein
MISVHGPDGRVWRIRRRPAKPGAAGYLTPGPWQIDAETDGERRRWMAAGLVGSAALRNDVALALRTGSEGPGGEVAVIDDGGPAGGSDPTERDPRDELS